MTEADIIPLPPHADPRRLELARDGALSLAGAAEFLSIAESNVRELLASGKLVGAHLGRRRVVSRASVVAYLAERLELEG